MDDEDEARYHPNAFGAMHKKKLLVKNVNTSPGHQFVEDDDDDNVEANRDCNDEDDDNKDDVRGDHVQRIDLNANENEEDDYSNGLQNYPNKRKIRTLSSYEIAAGVPNPTHGGRNSFIDWTETETFILLDAWGGRCLKHGKKILCFEEWQEVADMVSQESKRERTITQCRNRMDKLKIKYKKERMKLGEKEGSTSEWVYFKKMDTLLSFAPQAGLPCGVDSGEYVFMNPEVYLNRSNGLDEMRDSPGNSESSETEECKLDNLLPPKKMKTAKYRRSGDSVKLLADSILKFGEVYERTENSKKQILLELENMRMEFLRDMELQRRQILEQTQAEIAKIDQGEDEEKENGSG